MPKHLKLKLSDSLVRNLKILARAGHTSMTGWVLLTIEQAILDAFKKPAGVLAQVLQEVQQEEFHALEDPAPAAAPSPVPAPRRTPAPAREREPDLLPPGRPDELLIHVAPKKPNRWATPAAPAAQKDWRAYSKEEIQDLYPWAIRSNIEELREKGFEETAQNLAKILAKTPDAPDPEVIEYYVLQQLEAPALPGSTRAQDDEEYARRGSP